MKKSASLPFFAGYLLAAISANAIDLKQSKFTQVINDVQIISGADKSPKPAALNDIFKVPDVLRTGPNSRAELVAEDQTITRVGANTIFSFDTANRTIDLQKGSLLFHSPKGKGGGTIQTGSATASVLGTTIVVVTTPSGGFKILVLEGVAEVKFLNGLKQHLNAGQMTFILPGGAMSPIIVFRLDSNTKTSQLINGFKNPLPSTGKIGDEVNRQSKLINKGKAVDTGLVVGDSANENQVEAVDPNILQKYLNHLRNVQGTPYEPVLKDGSYKTVDGLLVKPHDPEEPIADAKPVARMLSRDISITSSTLDSRYTFINETGPFDVIDPKDADCTAFLPNPFAGVFGRNININTGTIDLSGYGLISSIDFLAAQKININKSVNIVGFAPLLRMTALGGFHFSPDATVSASVFSFEWSSCSSMILDRANIQNTLGNLTLSAMDEITLTKGIFAAAGSGIGEVAGFPEDLTLNAGKNITATGTTFIGNSLNANAGGSIKLTGGAIVAPTVMLTAGDGIALDNVSMTSHNVQMTAANDIRIGSALHNMDLSSVANLNISGHTLVFQNVNFGGDPSLHSDVGLLADNPNTGRVVQRGYVNFINGVTYNHVLITSGNQNIYVNPESGSGIHIAPRF